MLSPDVFCHPVCCVQTNSKCAFVPSVHISLSPLVTGMFSEASQQCLGKDQSDRDNDSRGSDSYGAGNTPVLSARALFHH